MVTGKAPFQRGTKIETLSAVLNDTPAPLSDRTKNVPPELQRIISRCLRRNPEDRYNDTRDLVAALRDLGQQRVKPPVRAIAFAALVLAVVATIWLWPERNPEPTDAHQGSTAPDRPNWILVADFEGPPDDPNLAATTRDLVVASLEHSEIFTPLTRPQLRRGLKFAMKADTTRIVGDVAHDLATRVGARAYVEGRISRVLSGFSVVLRALSVESQETVTSVSAIADNEGLFLSTVDRLGRELRERLGEKSSKVQATRSFGEVTTPSLEAYRLYVEATNLFHDKDPRFSMPLRKQAIKKDPDFALAWLSLSISYYNVAQPDSARYALEEALRRPERLTANQLVKAQALHAFLVRYDLDESLRLSELLVQRGEVDNYNNVGVILHSLGRFEEGTEAYKRAYDLAPFGPSRSTLTNRATALINLGRYDEALKLWPELEPASRQYRNLLIRLAQCEWAEAESLAVLYARDECHPWICGLPIVSARATRGRIAQADSILQLLQEKQTNRGRAQEFLFERLSLAMISGQTQGPSSTHVDTTTAGFIIQGIAAAASGDLTLARSCRRAIERKPEAAKRKYKVDALFLDAQIAAKTDQWRDVVLLLENSTTVGHSPYLVGRLPIRWLIALAHERLKQLPAAAEGFRLVLTPTQLNGRRIGWGQLVFGIPYSFAHHRLVLLYSKMGRVEDARRHWEIFEKTFTNPDPELVPMVEEARRALEEAEAKAAS
jgi:tetratricopeptide (TPR) repeat protein